MRLAKTNRFNRNLRQMEKRGKNAEKLWDIVDELLAGAALAPKHYPHILSGKYAGQWECHIEPDWLLIWEQDDDTILLVRTGSHSDLF